MLADTQLFSNKKSIDNYQSGKSTQHRLVLGSSPTGPTTNHSSDIYYGPLLKGFTIIKKYLLVFFTLFSFNIFADEGMWEPYQMELLQKELRANGYKGNVSNVSDLFKHPMSAIVSLGGCSAAFVSSEGLIATNYCLLYTSPSPRDTRSSRMPSSA